MKMAERGFVALAFDPSYTGESSGEPRRTASPDINTEDFMAAVDFLSKQDNVSRRAPCPQRTNSVSDTQEKSHLRGGFLLLTVSAIIHRSSLLRLSSRLLRRRCRKRYRRWWHR